MVENSILKFLVPWMLKSALTTVLKQYSYSINAEKEYLIKNKYFFKIIEHFPANYSKCI